MQDLFLQELTERCIRSLDRGDVPELGDTRSPTTIYNELHNEMYGVHIVDLIDE